VKVIVHPAARGELAKAARFYEDQAAGLGLDFFREVERILRAIEDSPEIAPLFDSPYRRHLCRRFPFAVV
jgi:hypothetical protein